MKSRGVFTNSSRKGVEKVTRIQAKVGAANVEIDGPVVIEGGNDIVEGNECTGSRSAIEIPDIGVGGITSEGRSASWDDAILGGRDEATVGGEDGSATHATLVVDGSDDDDLVTGSFQQAIEFSELGSGKAIVISCEDGDGGGASNEGGSRQSGRKKGELHC